MRKVLIPAGASANSMTAIGGLYLPSHAGMIDSLGANPAGLPLVGSLTLDLNLTGIFALALSAIQSIAARR
jgi:hypothetical protein